MNKPPVQGKSNGKKAQEFGRRIAKFQFKDYKRLGFSYISFPEKMRKLAESFCFSNFSSKVKNLVVLERLCGEAAYQEAKLLVEKHGL